MGACGSTDDPAPPIPGEEDSSQANDESTGNDVSSPNKEPAHTPSDADLFAKPNGSVGDDSMSPRHDSPWLNRSHSPFKKRNRAAEAKAASMSPRSPKHYEDELKARDTQISLLKELLANQEEGRDANGAPSEAAQQLETLQSEAASEAAAKKAAAKQAEADSAAAKLAARKQEARKPVQPVSPESPLASPGPASPMATPAVKRGTDGATSTPAEVAAEFFGLINEAKQPEGFTGDSAFTEEVAAFLDSHKADKKKAKSLYASTYTLLHEDAELIEVMPKKASDDTRTTTLTAVTITKDKALKKLHKAFFSEVQALPGDKFACEGSFKDKRATTQHNTTIEILDLKIKTITDIRSVKMSK